MSPWPLFLAGAFLAEVIGTVAGFGAATVLTPIAAWFMDIRVAIAVVTVFHLFGNASRLVFFGRHIRWRIWARFGLTGVLFSFLGAAITSRLPAPALTLAFGVFLLLYVGLSVFAASRFRLPDHPMVLTGGGVLSGFIAGLIGTGGAIRSACLLVFGLPKEAYIGTSAAIALIVDATRLPVYLAGGFIPSRMVPVLLVLTAVAFTGAWVGQPEPLRGKNGEADVNKQEHPEGQRNGGRGQPRRHLSAEETEEDPGEAEPGPDAPADVAPEEHETRGVAEEVEDGNHGNRDLHVHEAGGDRGQDRGGAETGHRADDFSEERPGQKEWPAGHQLKRSPGKASSPAFPVFRRGRRPP